MERIFKLDPTTLRLSHIRSAILMCSSRTDLGDRFGCIGALNAARSMYVLVAKQ
jgi:hypothetical protein